MTYLERLTGDGRGIVATVVGHLVHLRTLLIRSAIALAITTAISFTFARQIFHFFTSRAGSVTFIYTDLTGMVGTYLKVCFYSGIALAMPYFIYEVLMLIRPFLRDGQKRYLYAAAPAMLLLFITGVVYTYYIFLPPHSRSCLGRNGCPASFPCST